MKLKLMVATLLASLATIVAATGTMACAAQWLEEPKCPDCLLD